MVRRPRQWSPLTREIRLPALTGIVAVLAAVPLAVASAGPVGDGEAVGDGGAVGGGRSLVERAAGRGGGSGDGKEFEPGREPLLLGLGLATAARCGPELVSPDGVEAQTCVLNQGRETWARTYYRNATGEALDSVLSLMAPGGRTVQMRCPMDAGDEPDVCETPRRRTAGDAAAYTAVAEFARGTGDGPLLLRSGSNSPRT
ncbi:hypothetical protein ACFV6E_18915 [Streptomyces sp. NPDC059785]|uniref:hypothetical protein n=1 Tax=unclassified Streptomyces TaxID=2593676 RepID=UPI00365BEC83